MCRRCRLSQSHHRNARWFQLGSALRANWLIGIALLAIPAAACAQTSYLDDGTIRLGVDLSMGGSITYLQDYVDGRNLVNDHDTGREIQESYYSGPQDYNPNGTLNPNYPNWPWNPIQSGDVYGNQATVLASSNNGSQLYVKTQPLQWALNDYPGDCTFETWLNLSGDVVNVHVRLANTRSDLTEYPAQWQELPAIYTVGTLDHLYTYSGTAPFTSAPVTQMSETWPATWWRGTEHWEAQVDNNGFGVGVFEPQTGTFGGGLFGTAGTGGPTDDTTSYMAPIADEILDHNIVYDYSYNLIVGSLSTIRQYAYDHQPDPKPDYHFTSDRQHWSLTNATDTGQPTGGIWRVNLNSNDPQLIGPACGFNAADVPKLYIRAAYHLSDPTNNHAQLFWELNNAGDPQAGDFNEAQSLTFNVIPDGEFHTYELSLADISSYSGFISQLRFDPVYSGQAGDYVDVQFISAELPEPGGAMLLLLGCSGLLVRRRVKI